ncbi:MAG TPA: hypothetical protein G4O13_04480 [Dehalococcoidia bacterium]|nr:hypothetical protein [Dehalococcoidia bacterium]
MKRFSNANWAVIGVSGDTGIFRARLGSFQLEISFLRGFEEEDYEKNQASSDYILCSGVCGMPYRVCFVKYLIIRYIDYFAVAILTGSACGSIKAFLGGVIDEIPL